jgi:hypothetical protein
MRADAANRIQQRMVTTKGRGMKSQTTVGRIGPVRLALMLLLLGLWVELALAAVITNEPAGFNGYAWGARISEHPSLKLMSDPALAHPLPGVDVYENPSATLTLNGVTFTKIQYRFYKDQLGAIHLTYEGRENRNKLLHWIEEQFGKLPLPERKQKNIEWHGANTVINLGYDVTTNQGRLWFIYLLLTPFDNSTTNTSGY